MKTTIYLLLLAIFYNLPTATAKNNDPVFTENAGQITDQHHHQRKDIDYKLEANGVTLFVGKGQLHYQWTRSQKEELKNNKDESNTATDIVDNISIYRMDVTLVGANKDAVAVTEDIAAWTENYYLPQCRDGATAHSYKKITYKEVYPNIDWVLYLHKGQVKYDFVIHPGGSITDIKLRYDGATELSIEKGALTATTPYGSLTETAPISYIAETGENIPSAYLLKGNELQYTVNTDHSGTLVIDPGLLWCTYYGSTNSNGVDIGNDVATDRIGGVYMVGITSSSTNIATTGTFQTSYNGGTIDGYIVKFDDSGTRQWGTYYGGGGSDYLLSVAVDNNGGLYAVGHTDSSSNLASSGAHQTSFGGTHPVSVGQSGDIIFIKLNTTNGQRQWSTYYGGTSAEHLADVDCDDSGYVYITGWGNSPSGIATAGSYQDTVNTRGDDNSFIAKFTPAGVRVWGTYFSDNNGRIQMRNISCDHNNNIYISGRAAGPNNGAATIGAYQTSTNTSSVNDYDGILTKFSGNGNRLWTTFIGDSGYDIVLDNVCDEAGNVYIIGRTSGPANVGLSQLVSATGYDTSHNGSSDIFLMKFSPTGTMLWGTFYGGTDRDEGYTLDLGANGNLYAGGSTSSSSGIATTNGYQNVLIGNINLFLASFDTASGYPKWGSYFGKGKEANLSHSDQRDMGLATNPKGIVFLSSFTASTGLATTNAHQQSFSGNIAALLPAFFIDTVAYIQEPYNDTIWCLGDTLRIPYSVNAAFETNNNFSIELSDATGSFSSPTTIGTRADTVGDTIVCIVPLNTPAGNGYKIRISSSAPAYNFEALPFNIKIDATVAGFSASSNTPVCAGDSIKLNGVTTSTGVSWSWAGVGSFGSTAEDTFIDNATTAMSGDYILTATLNSSGCSLKDTVSVLVKALPNKPTTSSNAPLCAGGTLNLTGSSTTSGVTYSWAGPGSYTSSVQNPSINSISAGASGDYICSATANGCSSKDTIAVVINPIPNKPTAASNSPLCAGQDLNLTASTITGATYAWWGPAAFSSTTQNPTRNNITTSHAGTYYVSATVNGCTSDTDSVVVLVNPDPQVNIVATPGNDICAGQSVSFVAFTANAGTSPSFQWMLNGAPAGSSTTSYTNSNLQSGDVVYCIMNATGNCSSAFTDTSNITTMTVSPVVTPSVSISSNPTLPVGPWTMVTFNATVTNGGNSPTFQWKRNGQDVVGATSDTWGTAQLNNNDVISVVLYSDHKCPVPDSAVSNAIDVLIDLGVDDITGAYLQLYPNPNNGSFTIKGNVANNNIIDLTIINKLGQTVHQATIQPQLNTIDQQVTINKELAAGVYLLQIRTEDGVSTMKLHIQ